MSMIAGHDMPQPPQRRLPHEDRDQQRPRDRSRARRRPRRRRCTSPPARSPRSATAPAGLARRPRRSTRAASSSRRASSTSPRGCASRASSTRRRSNRRCRRRSPAASRSLACPPDTDPPLDEPGLVEMLKHRARSLNQAHVYPVGALTVGLAGATLTEMGELAEAGCVAFSQADVPLADTQVLLPRDAVRGDVRLPRLAAPAGRAPRRAAASRTTARSRRGSGLPRIPACAETIALGDDPRAGRARPACACTCAALSTRGRRGDGARGEARGPAGHLRRRRPSPAPVRRRHRLVRRAVRASCRRCAGRATARRCARGSPTARSTSSAPTTRRSTTTASRCRSARRSRRDRARTAAAAHAQVGAGGRRAAGRRARADHAARRPRCSASRPATLRRARRRHVHLRSGRMVEGRARALRSQGKNTPFLGLEVPGRVRCTLVGGQVVHEA